MGDNVLLVFGSFDPVDKYKLLLVQRALRIVADIGNVIFLYEEDRSRENIFSREEKLALLGASIPRSLSPKYLIDGDSFHNKNLSLFQKISAQKDKYKSAVLYLLLDSREFQMLQESKDFSLILSLVQIVIYILPEDKDILSFSSVASHPPLIIATDDILNDLSKASAISYVNKRVFDPLIIEYMNKSSECAIKRVKSHLSESRFKHSLRVAGTIKGIMEILDMQDAELNYDAYLAAIYHDICKEMPMSELLRISREELNIAHVAVPKILHGPVGAWYLKKKYLLDNPDILEAVAQHTVPSKNPKLITMLLYLADHLETGKKGRYPEEVYAAVWELIDDHRPEDAFRKIKRYCDSQILRKS